MAKLIALALVLASLVGGTLAGHLLAPPAPVSEVEPEEPGPPEAVQLREPFVVPILRDGRGWAHVVMTLGIESAHVRREDVVLLEPRLRDRLNAVLYRHGSLGGFDGDFTSDAAMTGLRDRLDEAAALLLDDPEARILLISMSRQGA